MKTPSLIRTAVTRRIALGLVAAALGLLGTTANRAQTNPKPSMTVTTARPAQGSLPVRLAANGNIAAWQEASVGSEVGGLRLAEVQADVGDFVQKGQVLAVFASDSVQADVAQARAAVAEATANLAEAVSSAERARTLVATGALSTQQINQYFTGELTAHARLESARATLQQQELRLRHTQVRAPDSGVIALRSATVGAVAGVGTELFRLVRQGRLEWRAEVTATELGRVPLGTQVQITTASGASVQGKVRKIGPTVDLQTRTALVYVDLVGNAKTLPGAKPGMFARGEFALGATSALTVPQQAVVVRDGFNYLFKVDASNKVTQHKVQVGRRIGDQVEITQGIAPDATVAVTGAGFLNDGDTVRVNNAPRSAASGQ